MAKRKTTISNQSKQHVEQLVKFWLKHEQTKELGESAAAIAHLSKKYQDVNFE